MTDSATGAAVAVPGILAEEYAVDAGAVGSTAGVGSTAVSAAELLGYEYDGWAWGSDFDGDRDDLQFDPEQEYLCAYYAANDAAVAARAAMEGSHSESPRHAPRGGRVGCDWHSDWFTSMVSEALSVRLSGCTQ